MSTIALIIGIVAALGFLFFSAWLGRSRSGTLGLFSGAYHHALKTGASRQAAYHAAFVAIKHRAPIGEMTSVDLERAVDAFSHFENPWDPSALLQHALKTERIEFLREPYLGRLVAAGRRKGATS